MPYKPRPCDQHREPACQLDAAAIEQRQQRDRHQSERYEHHCGGGEPLRDLAMYASGNMNKPATSALNIAARTSERGPIERMRECQHDDHERRDRQRAAATDATPAADTAPARASAAPRPPRCQQRVPEADSPDQRPLERQCHDRNRIDDRVAMATDWRAMQRVCPRAGRRERASRVRAPRSCTSVSATMPSAAKKWPGPCQRRHVARPSSTTTQIEIASPVCGA